MLRCNTFQFLCPLRRATIRIASHPLLGSSQGIVMAYFAFTDYSGKEFVFRLDNEQRIEEARRILSGDEQMSVHVMGRIRKRPEPYNPGWSFVLDPDTISFFTMAIEVCDS